jgi:PAS domain S-box-containing protein
MQIQKYDILSHSEEFFEERYWLPENIPVLDKEGEVKYIIHSVKDMTEQVVSFANAAYIELMNNRQLVGKTLREAIPELEGQPFLQLLEQVFDTGIPFNGIEVPATAVYKGLQEPATRYFNLSYTAFRNMDAVITGVLAYAYDVTEQVLLRKKEATFKLNQQLYLLFMQAPVGICILTGPEYIVTLANHPVLEIWGKDASIIGKPLLKALPEIDGQEFVEILDGVKNSGKSFHASEYEASLVRDGKEEQVYLNFVYQPYYDSDGTITGVVAIATEMTEHVLARKKIEYAEETARLAIESAELGSYEINLETNEMTTNPRFNAIWGFEHPVHRSEYAASINVEDRPTRVKAHTESLKTGKLFYEARVNWNDGSEHWIRVNGKVLYDVERKPLRLLGVIQDITEQRAFAEKMTRVVAERTEELQKANAQLGNSNKELEQFAYITSHDLQEPLRKIQVFSSKLLGHEQLPAHAMIQIEKISGAAKRMGGLIKDLLEYSRLSQSTIHFREVNLGEVLQQVLSDFELMIVQKNATVKSDLLETIDANPVQINQLFFNLLGNALKFSKPDVPPVITIQAEKLSKEKKSGYPQLLQGTDYYEIIFTDNGIGFDQEYAERIFTVFQRLNQQSEYGGYGIGLALCSKVVSNHNGLLLAEAALNEGAKFTVMLPYRQG